jgi:hypothetical protein
MPTIPLVGTPQLQGTAADPLVSSPSFSSNSYGGNVIDAGAVWSGMGRAIGGLGEVAANFADKIREADDYNAIHEARRIADAEYTKHQSDIQNRMDFDNFGASFVEAQKRVEENTKGILEKASPRAQMIIQNELADMSSGVGVKTSAVAVQRKVSDLRESGFGQINSYVDQGNISLARQRATDMDKSGLLSPAEKEKALRGIDERDQYNQVSKQIQTAPHLKTGDQLRERDADGTYKNNKFLPENTRLKLAGDADHARAKWENNVMDGLERELIEGDLTEEKVGKYDIDQGIKNRFISEVRAQKIRLAEGKAKNIEGAWNKVAADTRYEIANIKWNTNPAEQEKQYNAYLKMISDEKFVVDGDKRTLLLNALQSSRKAFNDPDSPIHKSPAYKMGLDKINALYKINGKLQGKLYTRTDRKIPYSYNPFTGDNIHWDKYDKDEDTQARLHAELLQDFENTVRNKPDMTPDEINKYLDNRVKDLHEGTISKFFVARFRPESMSVFQKRLQDMNVKTGEMSNKENRPRMLDKRTNTEWYVDENGNPTEKVK